MKTIKLFFLSQGLFACLLLCSISLIAQEIKVSSNNTTTLDEGEAKIAINPADSNKMAFGFMQISSTQGNTFQIYTSANAGNTWQKSGFIPASLLLKDFPNYTSIAGGGDILMAYDKTGKLYCSWIYVISNHALQNPYDSLIWASYWGSSIDNGHTFTLEPGDAHFFGKGKFGLSTTGVYDIYNVWDGICDRDWMAVDLTNGPNANKLYIAYINYTQYRSDGLKVRSKASGDKTFSNQVMAYQGLGQLSNIMVDGNGMLHYIFADLSSNKLGHVSSSDGGKSFSLIHSISDAGLLIPTSFYINTRENAAPSLAIDGANNLHVVWNDFIDGGFPKSYYSKSNDGGLSWLQTSLDISKKFNGNVFMPTVSAINNRVSISAYVLDDNKKSEFYIVSSNDYGQSFSPPFKVSTALTDFNLIGKDIFIGDYTSSARTNCLVYGVRTDARTKGQKLYVSKFNDCAAWGIQEITPINATYSLENLYPVPAHDFLNLDLNSEIADQISIDIMDVQGKIISSEKEIVSTGKNVFSINVVQLAAGNYLLKMVNKHNVYLTRMFAKK